MSNQYEIGSLDVFGPLAPYFRGGLLNNSQIQPMGPARTTVTDIQKMYADKPFVPGSVTGIPTPTLSQDVLRQGVGGAYNLETGQMKPTGLMGMFSNLSDSLADMSPEETVNLVSGISGLLNQTAPAPMELQRLSIPSATAGLRLGETDLSKYYQGLL